MTSPATEFAAIAKPARLMPVMLIRAINCLLDIPSYAFASQSSIITTSIWGTGYHCTGFSISSYRILPKKIRLTLYKLNIYDASEKCLMDVLD
jgi:hypothetical protein